MTYRFMRMLVFFDLPTNTPEGLGNYRRFRKFLLNNGFVMVQESVYSKLLLNASMEQTVTEAIKKNRPPEGIVQLLTITEKQFQKIECITGKYTTEVIDTDERLVVI